MIINSGKFEGKHSEDIVLKEPDYVVWYIQQLPHSKLAKAFVEHANKFNNKHFTAKSV